MPFTSDAEGVHQHGAPNLPQTYGECLIVAGWDMAEWNANQAQAADPAGEHTHTAAGGDAESRPLNIYVDFIIKAVDIP